DPLAPAVQMEQSILMDLMARQLRGADEKDMGLIAGRREGLCELGYSRPKAAGPRIRVGTFERKDDKCSLIPGRHGGARGLSAAGQPRGCGPESHPGRVARTIALFGQKQGNDLRAF